MKTSQFAVHMGIQLTITVLHETFIRHPICDVQITVSIFNPRSFKSNSNLYIVLFHPPILFHLRFLVFCAKGLGFCRYMYTSGQT